MTMVVVGLLAVVILVVFVALARHLGGGALVTQIGAALGNGANYTTQLLDRIYLAVIVPAFKRLGRATMAVLLVSLVGGTLIWILGDTIKWWVVAVALVIVVGFISWLVYQDMRTRRQYDLSHCLVAMFSGLLTIGAWFFVAAHICVGMATSPNLPAKIEAIMDARSLAILGAIYIAMAIEVLFIVLDLAAYLAEKGVDLAEGLVKVAIDVITKYLGLNFNIANQEGFRPAVKLAKARVKTAVTPILALGCLMPYPSVLGVVLVGGAFTYFLYERMEAVGIDTLERKQKASKFLEVIGLVLLGALVLVVFVPPLQGQFDTLILKVGALLVGIVQTIIAAIEWILGIKSHTFTGFPWYASLLGLIFTGLVAYAIWPKAETTSSFVRRVRQAVAVPLMVMAMAAIASLTITIFSWGSADQVGIDNGVTLSKMVAPKATLVSASTVRLSYPEIARASHGYVYERRVITDTLWTPLTTTANGITHFDDVTVVPGNTYAYRVAASFRSGTKEYSKEVLVTVPSAGGGGSGGSGGSGGGGGSEARTACSGPNCGNPGMESFCSRHPNVTECEQYRK